MAPLPPWREFVGTERLSFSRRSSTRRERRRWISPIASTATVEFAPLIASMMKTRRKNSFRNTNIPTDIVAFSGYKQRVEWLDLGTHFGIDEFLLLDSPPLDTTWRIIVEINAAPKPIIIQIPIYDDNVQEFIRACQ